MTKAVTPKVSVCIPVYKREALLADAVESVLAQTFTDFELIIVDNDSPDRTYEVAKEFATKDNRVRVFQNETNVGMTGNWNKCLEHVRGEYVWLLMSDDALEPTALAETVRFMDAHPKVGLTSVRKRYIDVDGKILYEFGNFPHEFVGEGWNVIRDSLMRGNNLGEPTTMLLRRSVITEVGGFDQSYAFASDWEQWLRMLTVSDFGYLNVPLARFRHHAGNLTTKAVLGHMDVEENGRIVHQFLDDPTFRARFSAADRWRIRLGIAVVPAQKLWGDFTHLRFFDVPRLIAKLPARDWGFAVLAFVLYPLFYLAYRLPMRLRRS